MNKITIRDPMFLVKEIETQWRVNFSNSNLVLKKDGTFVFNKDFGRNLLFGFGNECDLILNVKNPINSYTSQKLKGYMFFDNGKKHKSLIGILSEYKNNDLNSNIHNMIDLLQHIGIKLSKEMILKSLEIENELQNKERIFKSTVLSSTYWLLECFSNPKKQEYIDIFDPFGNSLGDVLTLSSIEAGYFEDIRLIKHNGYRSLANKLSGLKYSQMACKYYTKSIQHEVGYKIKEVEQSRIETAFYNQHFDLVATYLDEYFNKYSELEYSWDNLDVLYYMAAFSYAKIGRNNDSINFYDKIQSEEFVIDLKVEQLFRDERFNDIHNLYRFFSPSYSLYSHCRNYHSVRRTLIWFMLEPITEIGDLYKKGFLYINCIDKLGENQCLSNFIVPALYLAFKFRDIEFIKDFSHYIQLNLEQFLEYEIALRILFYPNTVDLENFLNLLRIEIEW